MLVVTGHMLLVTGLFATVGDKVCPGTEREEINSSTTDTVNTHVGIDRDIANTTEH